METGGPTVRILLLLLLALTGLGQELPDYGQFLFDASEVDTRSGRMRLERVELGQLELPTGRLTVSPALRDFRADAFQAAVPPGTYPVHALLGHMRGTRVTMLAIEVRSGRPVRWVELDAGQEHGGFDLGGYTDLPTGVVALVDGRSALRYSARLGERGFTSALFDELESRDAAGWSFAEVTLADDQNALVISTGLGSAGCVSRLGYDSAGNVCWLVCDMLVIPALREAQARIWEERMMQRHHEQVGSREATTLDNTLRWIIGLTVLFGLGFIVFRMKTNPSGFLCDRCKYNSPRYCTRPERPNAKRCPDFGAK